MVCAVTRIDSAVARGSETVQTVAQQLPVLRSLVRDAAARDEKALAAAVHEKGTLGALRTAWFALAFTCIGLETRVTDLVSMQGGRPAVAFLTAQAFNVVWTLALAYLVFGGLLFAPPVFR